jgi:phosphoserine phosphatase
LINGRWRLLTYKLTLFDLDYTLLPLDSDHAWGEFTTTLGWTDAQQFRQRNDAFYAAYQAGTLDIHDYVRFATAAVRAHGPQAARQAQARFMREVIEPAITPQALALVQAHQRADDAVVVVTATNEFVTRPIAQRLGWMS